LKTLFIIPGACSLGAMVALEWLNKPYQIGITTPEIRASGAFRKINPLGKVGALLEGDKIIYENIAILFSLVDENPDTRIGMPLNTPQRIQSYIWMSYLASTLHTAFGPLFHAEGYADASGIEVVKAKAVEKIKSIYAYLNSHLSDKEYFINPEAGIVDAQAYAMIRWSDKISREMINDYPHVKNFMVRMSQLPAVKNALYLEQGKPEELIDSSFAGYYTF
jgi:glutathione S-transferase